MGLARRFLRFATVGASGTAVQYAVLWAGVSLFDISAAIASAIGYLLGTVSNYLLNYLFTFESGKSHKEAATKYYIVLGVGWCINNTLMAYLVGFHGWNYWIAQIVTTGIGLLWNFTGSQWWAFRPLRIPDQPGHGFRRKPDSVKHT
jgi:putative flippase GtrA